MPQTKGSYAEIFASSAVNGQSISAESSSIATAIPSEQLYRKLDFKLKLTSGVPDTGSVVRIIRRAGDGATQAIAPDGTYQQESVGSFILKASTTGEYPRRGVPNIDENDTFYFYCENTTALTFSVEVRGRE